MRVKLPYKVIELNVVACYASNDIENKERNSTINVLFIIISTTINKS